MVSYGDWRQDDDYTLPVEVVQQSNPSPTVQALEPYGWGESEIRERTDDYYVITGGDIADVTTRAISLSVEGGSPWGAAPGVSNSWGYRFGDDFTIKVSEWSATVQSTEWHINARPGGFEYYPSFYGPGDPDAIGLEFEDGPPYDPGNPFPWAPAPEVGLSLSAGTLLATRAGDDSAPTGELDTGWTTDIRVICNPAPGVEVNELVAERDNNGILNTGNSMYREPLGVDVDLAAMEAYGWDFRIYAETRTVIGPHHLPEAGDSVFGAFGVVTYGWNLDRLAVVWIVRPPRYRFVYDTVPYRRLTQRGDGLAGGARRIHPRPKSIQGSNRRGGGFL